MKQNDDISEARRYLGNAHEYLKKAGKEDGYYQDTKYVRTACGTAYNAILIALEFYFQRKGKTIIKKKHQRKNVDDYKRTLSILNRKLLVAYDSAYHVLHLDGYYDGITNRKLIDGGMSIANEIITGIMNNKY